jgi:hypothetical protein
VVVFDNENDMMIVEVGLGDVMLFTKVVLVLEEEDDTLVSGGEDSNNWLKYPSCRFQW